jgi:hypothetical protein
MTNAENPQFHLCPHLLYVSGIARSYVNDVARATTKDSRREAIGRCLLIAKLIVNTVQPLARQAGGEDYAAAYGRMAAGLLALAGYDHEEHPENFPDDGGRQLILDRLADITIAVERLAKQTAAIHAAATGERMVAA